MPSRRSFLSSTVGSKLLVGVTGLSLVGFLIVHLIGNLMLYLGPETFNHYSHKLISNPLVYPAAAGLVAIFLLHAWKTIQLTLSSNSARPTPYASKRGAGHTSRKTIASSTMIWTGLFLVLFIPFHVFTFKYGAFYESVEPGVRDLYRLVVEIFHNPAYVALYVVGMIVIGFHLWHGAASTIQTLGGDTPRVTPIVRRAGLALALLLTIGFISIPLFIFVTGGRS
jgi:succinate dehydrogenase / fumarate reductase cytochrome b subunit